jgi:hypothetical protein
MGKFTASSAVCLVLIAAFATQAQDYVAPGSTVEGERLRGEGQFLKGAAWYELNAAKARQLDAQTERMIGEWNRQVYETYQRERSAAISYRKSMTRAQQEAAKKKMEEREERLRTKPTSDDIVKGDALNALLVDLSDPSLSESSWRNARVDLPPDLSIRSLVFRFAPKTGDKNAQEMSRGLIALGRLDLDGRWPVYLQMDKLKPERAAYEASYRKVRDQSMTGGLKLDAILALDQAVEGLKKKISVAVPSERGFRSTAAQYVEELKKSTRMFDASTISFAQEMISDTQRHEARTVGELLGFMRKYRLLFASAEKSVGGGDIYGRLYGLMRNQKGKMGLVEAKKHFNFTYLDLNTSIDLFQKGSVWVSEAPTKGLTLIILERNGENFSGRLTLPNTIREFTGTVKGNKFQWLAKDVNVIQGNEGHNNYGTIVDDQLLIRYSRPDLPKSGSFVMRLKRD